MPANYPIVEVIPHEEIQRRHDLCRTLCQSIAPEAQGMLIFSRINIYYLTGTYAYGVLWVPIQGEPALFVYKGLSRCRLESKLYHIYSIQSFADMENLCSDITTPLGKCFAAEMGALPWALSIQLQKTLAGRNILPADTILTKARAQKSTWELKKMRLAGQRHNQALCQILPSMIQPGMSERSLAHISWKVFFSLGHGGINRMGGFGEECFLGHIAAGDNGNYPSHFNGPLGLKGEHPSTPVMGNPQSIWRKNQVLAMDIGFILEGYHTDKTQVYFSGDKTMLPDVVRRAHDACIEIQNRAAESLKVGAIPSQIWDEAKQRAEKMGFGEGFMGIAGNKVPFLGHGIGLVIDEYPVLAPRFDEPLQEGMVMAIEPKVGIPGIGMVGVENTFEVKLEGGCSITGQDFSITCVE